MRIELLLRDGPEASSVAGQCRAYRHALALTQVEAAERCGFSRRSWQRWEAGECQPTIKDTRQLWRRLDKEMAPFRQHELDAVVLPAEVEDAPRCYLADCENVLTETRITVGWLRDSPAGSRSHCQVELCGWGCVERFASIEQAGIRE